MSSSQNITAFGIGNMGAALSHALLKVGIKLTVWNRTTDRPQVKSVVQAGAVLETDVKSAIKQSDGIVIFCVVDYDAMYKLLDPIKANKDGLAGKTIVNLTNGTPKQAVAMGDWLKARGAARYFDGAVLVSPEMIATPKSMLIYSGESQKAFDGIKSAIASLGHPLYNGPEVDSASALDLAMLATWYGMVNGALVGMGIMKGANTGRLVAPGAKLVTTPIITALASYLDVFAAVVDSEDWADNAGMPMHMQAAAIGNILQAAKDAKVDASGLEGLACSMGKAVEDGWADGNLAAAIKYMI